MIKFLDIVEHKVSVNDYARHLEEYIGQDLLFHPEPHTIVFYCLNRINFRGLKPNRESVEDYSLRVLRAFFSNSYEFNNPIKTFLKVFLNFGFLPSVTKFELEFEARKDLRLLNELLEFYQTKEIIKAHILKGEKPRNHQERKILTFYLRAVSKEREVLLYLSNNIHDIAIKNARPKSAEHKNLTGYPFDEFKVKDDFPYKDMVINKGKLTFEINFERIDYRRINPLRNKSYVMHFEGEIKHGYTKEINKEILLNVNPTPILKSLIKRIARLPYINDRIKIFKELEYLFINKKWYGFYSLALPQVEGIFSEMQKIGTPSKSSHGSLTDKVQAVAHLVEGNEIAFDYYAYYLPDLRNKFAHSGNDSNIKEKSFYLLIDLQHLLGVYEELNSPLSELFRIFQEGKQYFKHVGDFARYLYLIQQVKHLKQDKEIVRPISSLIKELIKSNFDLNRFLKMLEADFQTISNEFEKLFSYYYGVEHEETFYLFKSDKREIINSINKIEIALKEGYFLLNEKLKFLMDTNLFLRQFQKLQTNIPEDLIHHLKSFYAREKMKLDILEILNTKITLNLPDEYLLLEQDLLHSVKRI